MNVDKAWIEKAMGALRAVPAPLKNEKQGEAFHSALAQLQDEAPEDESIPAIASDATAEIVRVINATVGTKKAGDVAGNILFGMKLLGLLGERSGVDCILRVARTGFVADNLFWTIVFDPFGNGHPEADRLFVELAEPLPHEFIAIALLDAANEACRQGNAERHPFDSDAGVARLRDYLTGQTDSYAHSACGALPFVSHAERETLLELARNHADDGVRIEAAWVLAKLGRQEGFDTIAEACLDRNRAMQAMHYLEELGREDLVPPPARDPDFVTMAQMCNWLSHPNEFGEAPDTIELFDKRTIYWPPTDDTREMRIFKYRYEPNGDWREEAEEGVGMVGSITFALFGDTDPSMDPKDIYGRHCCWELRMNEDGRMPEDSDSDAEVGWRLIEAGS
ncbi:MAG: HEAT repeat domain-containing protein [Phycisphaeraceae bacterium]|nr:HEAT repeat domain-containing protein [Phycisphaeraceae bacterium]